MPVNVKRHCASPLGAADAPPPCSTPRARKISVMRSAASTNCGVRRASRPRGRGMRCRNALDAARARAHHHDAVGEQHRLVDRMRDEQHRLARREPQRLEVEAHLLARQRVERAERLVHQQQRRVVDQRARDRDALAHAARQLVRIAVGEVGEPDLREQLQCALAVRARLEPAQLDLHEHVGEHVAPVEQHRALEHDAEVGLRPVDDAGRRRAPRPSSAGAVRRRAAAACSCRSPTARRSRGTRRRRSRGRSARARASRAPSPSAPVGLGDAGELDVGALAHPLATRRLGRLTHADAAARSDVLATSLRQELVGVERRPRPGRS